MNIINNDQLVISGPPRCGNTKIKQVFSLIFDNVGMFRYEKNRISTLRNRAKGHYNTVVGHHHFVHYNDIVPHTVIVYRDFRDSLLSYMRVIRYNYDLKSFLSEVNDKDNIKHYYKEYSKFIKHLSDYNNDYIMKFKYEDFWNNDDFIYDEIEKNYNFEIHKGERDIISDITSLTRNKEISDREKGFERIDKNSGIHGNHIYSPEPGLWKKLLDDKTKKLITNLLEEDLNKWGYISLYR